MSSGWQAQFLISYAGPGADGTPVKDQGWRVYRFTYAKSHRGNSIKRKVQTPYRRLMCVKGTYAEALAEVERLAEKES